MARKNPRRAKRAAVLTQFQRAYLLTGAAFLFLRDGDVDGAVPFRDDAAARAAWLAHRDSLLDESGDGSKPWAWWRWDPAGKRKKTLARKRIAGVERGDRPVFPDLLQRGAWTVEDDGVWDVRHHQWHSEYAQAAHEHHDYAAVIARVEREKRFDSAWIRTWSDVEAVKQGCWFDLDAAEYAAAFFRLLRHTKGTFAGKPFVLMPWQRFDLIMPLFGWKRADGYRRFEHGIIEIPKKNGKSTLCSGISLLLLIADGEAGAEVYNAAADRAQAGIVFKDAFRMAERSPYLHPLLRYKESEKYIEHPASGSEYKALSADVATKEGLNCHGVIFDELHVQKNRTMFDTLVYGDSARTQAMFLSITTAGEYDPLSIGWEQHEVGRRNLEGGAGPGEDIAFFAYIRTVIEGKNNEWQDEYWWYRANPSLGVALPVRKFARTAKEAADTPTKTASFKRYRLNIWVQAAQAAFNIHDWNAGAIHMDTHGFARQERLEEELKGRTCFGGLDLSAVSDTTSSVLWFPPDEEDGEHYLLTYFWLPEDNILELEQKSRAPYTHWAEEKWLRLTPGNVVDLKQIRRDLNEIHARFQPESWRYDPHRAVGLVTELTEEDDLPMAQFGQGFGWMNSPTVDFELLMKAHRIRHCAHPVMDWQVGNCQYARDGEDRVKIVKTRKEQRFKVDGPVSAVMARDGAMRWAGSEVMVLDANSIIGG